MRGERERESEGERERGERERERGRGGKRERERERERERGEREREREDYKRWLLKRAVVLQVVVEYVICHNCKTEKIQNYNHFTKKHCRYCA